MGTPATFSEHDSEPVRGLPAPLPPGETLLWQGSPRWWSLALDAYRVRALAVYFGVIVLARGAWLLAEGATPAAALAGCTGPAAFSLVCLAMLTGIAALAARGTVYTVTSRRVVVRQGIALSSTINLPFTALRSADLRGKRDGTGDIALELLPEQRVSYLWLWPHVRPWHWTRPQPMLRNLADAEAVGSLLARAEGAASTRGAVRVETGHPAGQATGAPISAGTAGTVDPIGAAS